MRDIQLAFISNRTTSRIFQILGIIERNRLFTIKYLAEKIKVTTRTIANDMKYIRDYFGESITLTSGNNGFLFEEKKTSEYKELKQKLLDNECLFEIIGNIFYGKFYRVDELAEHYHFSETSFRRMLTQSNSILKMYGLQWISNPLRIQGEEANLRKFFKDFYYEGIETKYTLYPDFELQDLILTKLGEKLGNYRIGSGTTPSEHYYTYFIAIKRSSLGFTISLPEDLKILTYEESDFTLMYSLKADIEELYDITFPKIEFAWIYLVTLCKRTLDRQDQEKRFYDHFHNGHEIADLTDDFLNMREVPSKDRQTIATFIRTFFLSRYINHRISPVLNIEMSDLKEVIFNLDYDDYQRNYLFLKNEGTNLFDSSFYLEDIAVALTVYSDLIFDIYTPSKKIYFLLEGDHFMCQYIRTKAIQQFGLKHELSFLPLQSLIKDVLEDSKVDLIVTNYSRYILDYTLHTEYLLLKTVPDEQDWQRLEKMIDPYRKKRV